MAITRYVKSGGSNSDTGVDDAHAWATLTYAMSQMTGDQSDSFLYIKRGGTFREKMTIAGYGTSGHPFTITAYDSGDLPKIYGSTAQTGWTNESSNIWYKASITSDPTAVWFITTGGAIIWGKKETLKASLNAEYDWWWDDPNDRLYVYSATDPGTAYTSVETPTRTNCVQTYQSYITVSYLECAFSKFVTWQGSGIFFYADNQQAGGVVEYCECHHNGYVATGTSMQGNGILFQKGMDSPTIRYNECYENGRRGICVFGTDGYSCDNAIVEHNTCYNNYHAQLDFFAGDASGSTIDNCTVRYNFAYLDTDFGTHGSGLTATHGILVQGNTITAVSPNVHHNIVLKMYNSQGIHLDGLVSGAEVYNNVVYGYHASCTTDSTGIQISANVTTTTLKNNIVMNTYNEPLFMFDHDSVSACDYNCWYKNAGGATWIYIDDVSPYDYHSDDFALYKTNTGWDTNGFWENPDFANAGGTDAVDYKLASDSPLINEGISVGLIADYWGTSIPQGAAPDIGVHEYGTNPPGIDAIVYADPLVPATGIVDPSIYVSFECLWKRDVKIRLN